MCCVCVSLLWHVWVSGAEVWGSHVVPGRWALRSLLSCPDALWLLCSVSLPLARVSRIPYRSSGVFDGCVSYVFECWRAGQGGSVRRQSTKNDL